MTCPTIRHDGEDVRIVFAKWRASRRRAADLDLRQFLVPKSLDDHDIALAEPIFPF